MPRESLSFAVDESGCLVNREHSVLVAAISNDPKDLYKQRNGRLERRLFAMRGLRPPMFKKKRGSIYRSEGRIEGNFRYLLLTPEMLTRAREIYKPESRFEESLNGNFHEFALRAYATAHLLNGAGFDPNIDRAIIDSYIRHTVLDDMIVSAFSRIRDSPINPHSIRCTHDKRVPGLLRADDLAYKLFEQHTQYTSQRVGFTLEHVNASEGFLHHGIDYDSGPHYVNYRRHA